MIKRLVAYLNPFKEMVTILVCFGVIGSQIVLSKDYNRDRAEDQKHVQNNSIAINVLDKNIQIDRTMREITYIIEEYPDKNKRPELKSFQLHLLQSRAKKLEED